MNSSTNHELRASGHGGERANTKQKLPSGLMLKVDASVTIFNLLVVPMTMCMCGHLGIASAAIALLSFMVLLSLAIFGRHNQFWERCVNYLTMALMAYVVAIARVDILWTGHSPILR